MNSGPDRLVPTSAPAKVPEDRHVAPDQLEPRLDLLREEYVLVRAWR